MPRTSVHAAMKDEAIRLRVEHRLAASVISRRTGVPMNTLHYWLVDYPLTNRERARILSEAERAPQPKKSLPGGMGVACEMADNLSTLQKGAVAENAVKAAMSRQGFLMANPDGDGDVVDVYVRRHGGQRVGFVQIRMTSKPPARNGLPSISLRRYRNGAANSFKKGDFHFLVGFCPDNSKCFVYSYEEVSHLANSVTISEESCEAWWKIDDWLAGRKTARLVAQPRGRRGARSR
jgi:hypothetical protein